MQRRALEHLYSPSTLSVLAGRAADSDGGLTPSEVLDRVRRSIWTETAGKSAQPIHLYRRDLERVARDAKAALGRQKDETTRLHLMDIVRQAREALDPPRRNS